MSLRGIFLRGGLGLALCSGLGTTAALAADNGAPPTARRPVTDSIQGVQVQDPYRWLENAIDPEVDAWGDAQTARARKILGDVPNYAAVKARLTELTTATSSAHYDLQAAGGKLFAMFNDPAMQQPQLVVMEASADPTTQVAVLDPNAIDAKGGTAIDWYAPSPDGKLIAVSMSVGGSEDGTLHIYDVATRKEVETPIPKVQYPTAGGGVAWAMDSKGFWYTRFPGKERNQDDQHFYQQAYFHRLGTAAAKDALILGEKDSLPRIAEILFDNRYSKNYVLASVQLGDGGKFAHWLLKADGTKVQLAKFDDGAVAAVIGHDDMVYLISRANAPKGKILKLSPLDPVLAHAKVIVPEGDNAIVSADWSHSLTLTKDRLFVQDIIGGPSQVRLFDLDGAAKGTLPLPDVSSVGEIEALPNGDVLYDVVTYLRPRYYARWTAATGKSAETSLKITSPAAFDDTEVLRDFAVSKDGTRIPVSIMRRKGTVMNSDNPTLLYGYGGYGLSQTPHFLGPRWRLWLDAGGIYVEANIRGGSEYGEDWHLQGNLTKKQNVFDDFAAAASMLIDRKYTKPEKLALMGGSNGGLLMGAMVTQNPGMARAVIASVGIYDMLRVELDPNGSFNTTEFGTVKDPDQFKALYAYSPYHHITAGTSYPAVMMTTGANDGRVNPMQSKKFSAALQAATSSDLPILLSISKSAGHGQGSALAERIEQQTDVLAFLYRQLGMKTPGTGTTN
ncbi:MAG: S9 family peptidase [Rhodospirillaceae bacterium]|nr:S9 family peptidase [Rhodospirillaceae bacterium]